MKRMFPFLFLYDADGGGAGGGGGDDTKIAVEGKKLTDFSKEDLATLEQKQPDDYKRLRAEFESDVANLTPAQKQQIENYRGFYKSEAEKAFAKRDEAVNKLKDRDAKDLEAEGKFKELNEALKTENAQLKEKASKVDDLQKQVDDMNEMQREELLSRVTDPDQKAALSEVKDLNVLRKLVGTAKIGTDEGRGGSGSINTEGKKWDDFTSEQLDQLAKNQRSEYDRLKKEKYNK